MNKTLQKVEAICKPHNIEMQASGGGEFDWDIWFFAPPKMVFAEANSTDICWSEETTIKGIITWIREEIGDGLRKLDPNDEEDYEILRISAQLEDEV